MQTALSYEQSLKQHYAANANRVGRAAPAHGFTRQSLKLLSEASVRRPSWQQSATCFDHHVQAYRAETSPRRYVEFVCKQHGYSLKELIGRDRQKELVNVRGLIAYSLRFKFGMSYPAIGKLMCRDHTSQISRVKAHCELIGEEYDGREIAILTDEALAKIRDAYEAGQPIRSLCVAAGVSRYRVIKGAIAQGWFVKKTSAQYRARINLDMDLVKADLEAGMSVYRMAEKHQVSHRSLSRYIQKWGIK